MIQTIQKFNPENSIRLRIYGDIEAQISEIQDYLYQLEYTYNSSYVFDKIIDQAKELNAKYNNNPPLPLSIIIWNTLLPATPEKVGFLVPDEDKLIVKSAVFNSPGFWGFVGNLNPLKFILDFLNLRHEHLKDLEYRNLEDANSLRLSNEKKQLENKALENQIIKEKIQLLKELGATDYELKILKQQLLDKPLKKLGEVQDKGLIIEAEIIDGNAPQNDVKTKEKSLYSDSSSGHALQPYGLEGSLKEASLDEFVRAVEKLSKIIKESQKGEDSTTDEDEIESFFFEE